MSNVKQVNKLHYEFSRYMEKERWISMWHQLDEIQKLNPESVLEIGPGPGFFKAVANQLGMKVKTMDLDPDLEPDYLGSATSISLPDSSVDVVCAFQMLEHLPYETALLAFQEMTRVSRSKVLISLPDAGRALHTQIHIAPFGHYRITIPLPFWMAKTHKFDGQHYWEINKRNYSLSKVMKDFSQEAELLRTFRVPENPYHRFALFQKNEM